MPSAYLEQKLEIETFTACTKAVVDEDPILRPVRAAGHDIACIADDEFQCSVKLVIYQRVAPNRCRCRAMFRRGLHPRFAPGAQTGGGSEPFLNAGFDDDWRLQCLCDGSSQSAVLDSTMKFVSAPYEPTLTYFLSARARLPTTVRLSFQRWTSERLGRLRSFGPRVPSSRLAPR